SELDIAMFKEALKVLNQFRLKTEERAVEKAKVERRLKYMCGESTKWNKDDGEEPPVLLETDERVKLMRRLEKDLLPPDITEEERESRRYSCSEKALRGYEDVLEKWQCLVKPGEAFSAEKYEKLKKCLDEHQAANSDSIGSATLFNYLIGGASTEQPVGDFWPLWQDPDTSDILWDWGKKQELEEDLEHLKQPIRFTPADAVHSRRLFMASDLSGKSAAVHGQGFVDVSLAIQEAAVWQEKRIRLHYSAPRLARDHISGEGKWLSPKLAAMVKLDDAPQQAFAECAVALMPERREGEKDRFLLNFPLSLDVTTLPGRAEREQRWQGQFNIADDTLLHLHWPGTRELSSTKVVKGSTPWWEKLESFTCLGIDLGQRTAAAAARIEATRKPGAIDPTKPHWDIGEADGKAWKARLTTLQMLRLPGEEADVWDGKELRTENCGSTGRCASPEERTEAQEIVTALGLEEEFRLSDEKADAARYYPAQNDHLLRAFKRAQGRLAKFQGWLCLLKEAGDKQASSQKKVKDAITAPRQARFAQDGPENPIFLKLRELAGVEQPDWAAIEEMLRAQVLLLQERLPVQLLKIASRLLPLRDGYWSWEKETGPDNRFTYRLQRNDFTDEKGHKKPKVRGQRGLSLPRIEQLEELRRRCQGLNKALRRQPGEKAEFGRPLQGQELPDPCPDLAEKLENIREQRVNQTAHLILAEALGLELTPPQSSKAERDARDIHGEYRKVREPVDFIVIENLDRYLTSQGRAPSENSRLMKWCHRQITVKLKQLCEPLSLPVLEVGAAYSSRFSSRSGVVGFRAVEVGPNDRQRQPWKKLLADFEQKKNEASEDAKRAACFFSQVRSMETYSKHLNLPLTLLWPKAGGPIFVPMTDHGGGKPMQADLNAAINIALRGIAAPDKVRLLHRLRAVPLEGRLLPKAENLREKALFGSKPEAFQPTGQAFGELKRGGTNFFLDAARLANFDQGTHPKLAELPLATGKGLWKKVKDQAWCRCCELNAKRIEKARIKSEKRDSLP
ncbi:MAG: type V CRISPR-associated protein Cas12b, partial [Prosthecobacter sp.]|nr:type V CRISPR-associated protein Cas12b [Prosthecobacter sp.]